MYKNKIDDEHSLMALLATTVKNSNCEAMRALDSAQTQQI